MKRLIVFVVLSLICMIAVSCGDADEPARRSHRDDTGEEESRSEEERSTKPTNTPKPTSTPRPTNTPTPRAEYFGNRSVQYEEENAWHQVFFSFSETENGELIRQDAIIHITITNDDGEVVYKGDHNVTSSDYSMWTSTYRGTQLLGCIYIKDAVITQGAKASGILTISAELSDGSYWTEDRLQITNLPVKPLQLVLPTTPVTVKEYGYNGKTAKKMEIKDISYECSDWNALTVTFTVKLLENTNGKSTSDYCIFGYKLKNAGGVIVSSGICSVGPLSVGDSILAKEYIGTELDRNETYSLEFYDYK